MSSEDMLAHLRGLGEQHPTLSSPLIDAAEGGPSVAAYRSRFGGLLQAYCLAGLEPCRDYAHVEVNRALRALHPGWWTTW